MKVLFHSNQLGLRGTEVALYDYAKGNEELLGNESVIVSRRGSPGHRPEAVAKFEKRFKVVLYGDPSEIDAIGSREGADVLYCIKSGEADGVAMPSGRTCVHVVFRRHDPHGDVYAYISEWLSRAMTGGEAPFVPHMVDLPDTGEDMRAELGISGEAFVIGRFGGRGTFDVPFASKAVRKAAARRKDLVFLFMNTAPLKKPWYARERSNIIHLEGTADPLARTRFINTCDAMLHARKGGETFGLAVAEFCSRGRPVITWNGSPETAHLDLLGDKGLVYADARDLDRILAEFRERPGPRWDTCSKPYSPAEVMKRFNTVFLK